MQVFEKCSWCPPANVHRVIFDACLFHSSTVRVHFLSRLKSRALWCFESTEKSEIRVQQRVRADNKENTKATHYWPFVGQLMRKTFPCHVIIFSYLGNTTPRTDGPYNDLMTTNTVAWRPAELTNWYRCNAERSRLLVWRCVKWSIQSNLLQDGLVHHVFNSCGYRYIRLFMRAYLSFPIAVYNKKKSTLILAIPIVEMAWNGPPKDRHVTSE